MLNLGVDFGSTYSSVSSFRRDKGTVEPMPGGMAAPYIPSVVSVKGSNLDFGRAAKMRTGKPGYRVFKGFKMLLPEKREEFLRDRGYGDGYTPEVVTEKFLESILKRAISYYHMGDEVNRLVIGVPEIWFRSLSTIDVRRALRGICQKYIFVKEVQIVSEPAAACAFFAYNFYKNDPEHRMFDGTILLIDYGGGTLDITLTQVETVMEVEGPGVMETRILECTGAGENEEGSIGKAAIVYMEKVMEESIRRYNEAEDIGGFVKDTRFYRAVDMLEEELQSRVEAIRDIYDMFGTEDPSDISEEMDEFTTIDYRGMDIPVHYSVMLEVYNSLIRPVLDEKLKEMIDYMKSAGIPFMDRGRDNFKIALVGGFGNFYLVADQISRKFSFSSTDKRQQGIIFNRGDRENAVSMGAALLAEGIIRVQNTAPYTIGIHSFIGEEESCDIVIRDRERITFGRPYFSTHEDGEPVLYYLEEGGLSELVFGQGREPEKAVPVKIREEYAQRLKKRSTDPENALAAVGFSLDAEGVLSIHIREYDAFRKPLAEHSRIIELNRPGDMLELEAEV